jgi:hypothetical protein
MIRKEGPDVWPDLQMDQLAWKKAQSEFPGAPLSVVATRAQEIKEAGAGGANAALARQKCSVTTDGGRESED